MTAMATDDSMKEKKILLQSGDEKMFEVDMRVATMSSTIKTMLETMPLDEGDRMIPIPLPNASSIVLDKVIEWGDYHKDNPVKLTSDDEDDEMDPHKERAYNPSEFDREYKIEFSDWDRKFFESLGPELMYELMLAANYLDIKELLISVCKYIAEMMRTRKPKEFWEHWAPLREKNGPMAQKQVKKQAEKPEASVKPRRSKRMMVEKN